MSQQKVDQKKLDKKNRRSILRKRKAEEIASITVVSLIGIAIVIWVGFSIYSKIQSNAEANATYEYHELDSSALQDYLAELSE